MKALLKRNNAEEPFSFSFVNEDGKIQLKSAYYKAKDSALKGIRAIKKNCLIEKRYVLKESNSGMFFFNVKSANGQVVGTSAMYPCVQDRTDAIKIFKILVPECLVEEKV